MQISNIAKSIDSVITRQLFNRAKQYDDVIDLTLGDPNQMTPKNVTDTSYRIMCEKKMKYSENAGLTELRNVISDTIYTEYNIRYNADSEIIVTVGGMEGIYLSLLSVINPNDEVIIFAPYYPNYLQMIKMCGGKPVIVNTTEEHGFNPDFSSFTDVITEKTKAIIVNSPNNPTGAVYSDSTVNMIANVAKNYNLTVLTDEVYKAYIYDNKKYTGILDVIGMKQNTVLINSLSKKYSMTGWRVGYVASEPELIKNMTKLQENIVACTSLPSQYAAIEALTGNQDFAEKIIRDFEVKRNFVVNELNKIPDICCKSPEGAFYAYVNLSGIGENSLEFAYNLLDKFHVAVVPGIAFGECGNKYIRICYAADEDILKIAIDRIKEYVINFKTNN